MTEVKLAIIGRYKSDKLALKNLVQDGGIDSATMVKAVVLSVVDRILTNEKGRIIELRVEDEDLEEVRSRFTRAFSGRIATVELSLEDGRRGSKSFVLTGDK